MEDSMINPPDPFEGYPDEDPYKEEPMAVISETLPIRGPYNAGGRTGTKIMFEVLSGDGLVIADVFSHRADEALENTLLFAAAPAMRDLLKAILNGERIEDRRQAILDTIGDAEGTLCECCDKLGQPSRMKFSSRGRAYHEECVTDLVRQEIAAAEKANRKMDDCPF